MAKNPKLFGISMLVFSAAVVTACGSEFDGLDFSAESLVGTRVSALTSIWTPSPGSTLSGSTIEFSWTSTNPIPSEVAIWVGSSPGSWDIGSKRYLPPDSSHTLGKLPIDGSTVYVRLWEYVGGWTYQDYTYTAFGSPQTPPTITAPGQGSPLPGGTVDFNWSAGSPTAAEEFALWVGSQPGGYDIWARSTLGTATSANVTGVPVDGSTVWVRLWYRHDSSWFYSDVSYTAASLAPSIISPAPGSTLEGVEQLFTWDPGTGSPDDFALWAGSTLGGWQYWSRSSLGATTTEALVTNLPDDGSTVYVRFSYNIDGDWHHTDHEYTAASAVAPLRVFVSRYGTDGALGGLTGADRFCQQAADQRSLGGIWMAWLSDSVDSPDTRFLTHNIGPYVLLDGTQIAADWADLTDGSLSTPIYLTETMEVAPAGSWVWTNTAPDGTFAATGPDANCFSWTNNASWSGNFGSVNSVTESWTSSGTIACHVTTGRLYCFEQ